MADHGVRKYDAETGRFTSIEPLISEYYSHTPYHYCRNNPISRVDGNGLDDYTFDVTGSIVSHVVNDQPDKLFFKIGTNDDGSIESRPIAYNSRIGTLSRVINSEARGDEDNIKECMGHCIINRTKNNTPEELIEVVEKHSSKKSRSGKLIDIYQFTSVNPTDNNYEFYINPMPNGKAPKSYLKCVSAAIRVIFRSSDPTNGATLYYSPKSMNPPFSIPKWNFNILTETTPAGIDTDSFRSFMVNK